MPRFKKLFFNQNSPKMKLFLQKNAKFSSTLPPNQQPPAAGGFPLASGSWGPRPQTPKTAPPIANFWLRACTHCPIVEKKKNQNLKKPKWFNDELMNLKSDKRRAERRLKKEFSKENRKNFCFIRNKYNFNLKETRYSYYTDNLSNAAKDSKALYKILNRLTGNVKRKAVSY